MTETAPTAETARGPREHRHALLNAERFEDDVLSIGQAASELSTRYAELIDFAYAKQTFGSGGRGNADGSERDVSGVLVATAQIRRSLGDACESVLHARNSLNAAAFALDQAQEAIERAHPDEFAVSERQVRSSDAVRQSQVAESRRAKARDLRREAEEMDQLAEKLERQVRDKERRAAAARARHAPAAPKRSSSNGWAKTTSL